MRSKYPSQPRSRSVVQVPPRLDRITEREECAVRHDRIDGGENKSKSVQRYYNGSIHGGTDQTILISSKHSLIIAAAVMSVHVIICLASAGVSCQTRMLAPPCVQNVAALLTSVGLFGPLKLTVLKCFDGCFKRIKSTDLCLYCQMKGAFFEGQQVSVLVSGSLWENPQTNLQRTKILRN